MIWDLADLRRFERAMVKWAEVRRRLRLDPHDEVLLVEERRLSGVVSAYWWHIELAHARERLAARWN
jgi:hypothetical protein